MRYIIILLFWFFACTYGYKDEYQTEKIPNDYKMLVDYAHIAAIAYCFKEQPARTLGDEKTNRLLEICNNKPYQGIEIKGTFNFNTWGEACSGYYAVDHDNKRILLAFRGTASRKDWLRNVNVYPVKYNPILNDGTPVAKRMKNFVCENCKVHRGYYKILKKHCLSIIQDVLDLHNVYSDYKLAVVGHSLGGALAVLSGIELQLMGHNPLVISYASPKVGNKYMAEYIDRIFHTSQVAKYIEKNRDFNMGYIRVVHKGDMIPKLPPTTMYQHCGFEYTINKKRFPHTPGDVEARGISSFDDPLADDQASITKLSYSKLWSDNVGKYEHNHYFIRITTCDSQI